ncbi:MAG: glycosyltransferase [Candidatus Dormibacteria bacterium]
MSSRADLVVFSHLRWDGVWQRPHHLVTRLAAAHERTFFVEEPVVADVSTPRLLSEEAGPVIRLIFQVPQRMEPRNGAWLTFADIDGPEHRVLISEALTGAEPNVWLYSPLALPLAQALCATRLVYDVMDDLASFAGASLEMKLRQAQALSEADVVFTGGRSLHDAVMERRRRPQHTFCYPSGVEIEHFRVGHRPQARRVAGYVGVIDERLNLALVDALATALPEWTIRMVGPVTKIPEDSLPQRANIEYLGKRGYAELPEIMAEFDVALMPFAINEATRSISPTKTLEYLAAGLPVVSTRVRDVERDCGDVVLFADDGPAFAAACESALADASASHADAVEALLRQRHWDAIALEMLEHVLPSDASIEQEGGLGA